MLKRYKDENGSVHTYSINMYLIAMLVCVCYWVFGQAGSVKAVQVYPLNAAQSFSAGAEMSSSSQRTSDGGNITTAYNMAVNNGKRDVYLYKTDANNKREWERSFGGSGDDEGRSVQQTDDGGYIITGYTCSYGAGRRDVYLIKTDDEGKLLWQTTYGRGEDDEGNYVQQTSDGGYIIVGYTKSIGSGGADVYIVKTDAFGKRTWEKNYGMYKDDVGRSLLELTDGYIFVGSTRSYGDGNLSIYLVKIYNDGRELWARALGGNGNYVGYFIQRMINTNYQVLAYVFSSTGQRNALILEVDDFGRVIRNTVMSEYNLFGDPLKPPRLGSNSTGGDAGQTSSTPVAPEAKEAR